MANDSELDRLRDRFPDWRIGARWVSAASGPDRRLVWATREGKTLTSWSAAALARDIEDADVTK